MWKYCVIKLTEHSSVYACSRKEEKGREGNRTRSIDAPKATIWSHKQALRTRWRIGKTSASPNGI
jgi:hypothetical protein